MEVKTTYRGWPGHFICAHQCVFRLNTLVECGKTKVVVSTVGQMLDPLNEDKNKIVYAEIMPNRYFETMAFHAKKTGEFWDADVLRQINFDSPWHWDKVTDEMKANNGHIVVVDEIIRKIKDGTIK